MEKPSGEYVRHQRVNGGEGKKNSGTDDDEDVDRSGVDRGGGGSFGIDVPQAIARVRVIEQVRRKTAHRRHQQLHARQDGVVSRMTDLVKDVLPSILATGEDTAIILPTLTVSTPPLPDLSNLSVTPSGLPETSVLSILSSDPSGYPDVPIESTEQVVLSSTPPPSPAETSPGMVIPTITSSSTSSTSSILESSSTDLSSSSTIVSPYTTVTSYWAPQTARNNGTTSSDTRIASTTTIDSRVVIFTQAPVSVDIYNGTSTQTPTSFTNSSISSTLSVNSTISTSTTSSSSESSTSLWPSTTEPGGGGAGGAGGGVTPTSAVPSRSPTSTDSSNGDSSPVSPGLLGGVLGGVAGFAFILLAILYLLRRYRRELAIQARDDAGYGGALGAGTGGGDGEQSIVQKSSMSPFAAAGGLFSKRSHQSQTSSETPAPGEPSFIKISGRKLPPVIGGPRPGEPPSVRSGGSSFYHDDDISWVGGPGTPISSTSAGPSRYSGVSGATPSSPTTSSGPTSTTTPIGPTPTLPPMGTSIGGLGPSRIPEERESDPELATPQEPVPRSTPILRQPSAPGSQTDVTIGAPIRPPFRRGMSSGSAGSAGSSKDPQTAAEIPPAPAIPAAFVRQMSSERAAGSSADGVGRSLPSRDGSRTSRFTEDIV